MRHIKAAAEQFKSETNVTEAALRWKVTWNPEAGAIEVEPVMAGHSGQAYPWDKGRLGVYVFGPSSYRVKKVQRDNPDWELFAEGDTEAVFVAPIADLGAVAKAIKAVPRARPRKVSEKEKERLRAHLDEIRP